MSASKRASYRMPVLTKVICIALIACFVVVGLIGLVLPIIPGLLFLFIAAILLARISRRFDAILKRNSSVHRWMKHADTINGLSISQRVRLSFWMAARLITNALESGINQFKKTMGSSQSEAPGK